MTTPEQPSAGEQQPAAPLEPYGDDAERWIVEHPGYRLMKPSQLGDWWARAEIGGVLTGELLTDPSLDGLHEQILRTDRRMAGA
jgi:hypothetical protein